MDHPRIHDEAEAERIARLDLAGDLQAATERATDLIVLARDLQAAADRILARCSDALALARDRWPPTPPAEGPR